MKTQRLKPKLDKSNPHLHTAYFKVHLYYTTIHPRVVQEGIFNSSFPVDSLVWCLPKRTSHTSHVTQCCLINITIFAENSKLCSSVVKQLEQVWYCRNRVSSCNITYVVQQDTQLWIWLNIYSQYVSQLDMFRTYRSILRSINKLCVAGLVCEDCVLFGASIR